MLLPFGIRLSESSPFFFLIMTSIVFIGFMLIFFPKICLRKRSSGIPNRSIFITRIVGVIILVVFTLAVIISRFL